MPNVVKIQSGYAVKPLSEFLGQPAPSPRYGTHSSFSSKTVESY